MKFTKRDTRLILLALSVFMVIAGCATLIPYREKLDESMRDYQRLLRWQESTAAAAYVAAPQQVEYLQRVKTLNNRVRIVEYEIKKVDMEGSQKKAVVLVEMKYHMMDSATVKTIVDTQYWKYDSDEKSQGWRLTSFPPDFN